MTPPTTWHPVVAAHELRAGGNIVAALVQGQELALWRSLQGVPQAWEDRCPHRGVRLTLGRIIEGRLSCAYHGWEYAADSGRCESIPAMPDVPVPGKVCVRTYPVREAQSMCWVRLDANAAGTTRAASAPASGPVAASAAELFCRSLALPVPIGQLRAALAQRGFEQTAECSWSGALARQAVRAFTLDAGAGLSFLHLWCDPDTERAGLSALHAAARQLRADIEGAAG